MSSVRDTRVTNGLDLSRGEVWLVHHVMVDRLTDCDGGEPQPWWALNIARKLEADEATLTAFEAWRLRRALLSYADRDRTAASDVALATAVVERLEEQFGRVPLS